MSREPSTNAGNGGGAWERLALASAAVPFRLKVATVWAVIYAVIVVVFLVAKFDTAWMQDNATFVAKGLLYTVYIAVGGIVLAIALAVLGSLGRISRNPIAYGVSGFYVSFFRGTPLIVQMFLIYLALPQVAGNLVTQFPGLGTNLTELFTLETAQAGILALGLNYGAYMTEIFRAGIESISHGQGEAADALGMTYGQRMRKVILPQAFRVIIPPTGNEFIAMMKDTALVSFLGVTIAQAEVFRRAQLVGKADFQNLEAYVLAAAIYWALTALFTLFQRRLEARVSRGYVRSYVDKVARKQGAIPPGGLSNPESLGGQH